MKVDVVLNYKHTTVFSLCSIPHLYRGFHISSRYKSRGFDLPAQRLALPSEGNVDHPGLEDSLSQVSH